MWRIAGSTGAFFMKPYLLRLHRWISLVFAVPLAVVIFTGLILSFQPMMQSLSITPGTIDGPRLLALLEKHDPQARASGVAIDAYAGRLRILQGRGAAAEIDLRSGEVAQAPAQLNAFFGWARRTHERLVFDLGWLVTASTIAMLTIIALGVLMGWPMLRNTLSGWHKAMAWFTLPLLILSPLTGLALAFGITLQGPAAPASGERVALRQAIEIIARDHDLSRLSSLQQRGGRLMARIDVDGELRAFAVTANGAAPLQRNWPRLIHEGNWSGVVASVINVLISVVFIGLLMTGLLIWSRRSLRQRKRKPAAT
jgi:uncharacterized iron-regulated membrane protein